MRLDDPLTGEKKRFRRSVLAPALGGGFQVLVDSKEVTFAQLKDDELLNSAALCHLFECSQRTLYRCISEEGLKPWRKVAGELLFKKGDVIAWWNRHRWSGG